MKPIVGAGLGAEMMRRLLARLAHVTEIASLRRYAHSVYTALGFERFTMTHMHIWHGVDTLLNFLRFFVFAPPTSPYTFTIPSQQGRLNGADRHCRCAHLGGRDRGHPAQQRRGAGRYAERERYVTQLANDRTALILVDGADSVALLDDYT